MQQARTFPIRRCGAIAREILAEDGLLHVVAAFDRCLYVAAQHGIACIGSATIGAGPINVEIAQPHLEFLASLGVKSGTEGRARDGLVVFGDRFHMDATTGETWLPPAMPPFRVDAAARGVGRLRKLASGRWPDDGLAALVFAPGSRPRSATERAAHASVAQLRQVFAESLAADAWSAPAIRDMILMVGLGPGFTPSGDDLLGGIMLALTAAGRTGLRDAMWEAIVADLDALTTPPSAMHLSAAADGMAGDAIHALVNDVLEGGSERLPALLERVSAIGHTSGWDALAGILLGFEALTLCAAP